MQASEHCVVEALSAAARGGYDALMPDCVLDPGVSRLQGAVHVPVIGMLRLNLCYATAVGAEWGAVVRNEAIAAELGNVIQTYGFGKTLSRVRVLGLDVESIADEQAWQAAVGSAAMELADGGVSSIINGCSAAETGAGESRPRIIDPARQALRLMAAGEGL
jgi:Asp/Glu/hydantoin racemase